MGKSLFEKIYAVCVVLTLCSFLGSVIVYYFQHHDITSSELINSSENVFLEKIDWVKLYPFDFDAKNNDTKNNTDASHVYNVMGGGIFKKYISFVEAVKFRMTLYTSEKFFVRGHLLLTAKEFAQLLHWPKTSLNTNGIVVDMTNGYLTDLQKELSQDEIDILAESVTDFASFLSDEGIGFIYANIGYKINPQDNQLSNYWAQYDFSNKNSDNLIQTLRTHSIDTIDFREELLNAELNWYEAYYIGDNHWKNVTQLWAAGIIASKLNRDYGFSFDLSYFNKSNYDRIVYEKIYLGNHGRAKVDLRYLEDYELILPKFATEFTIDIPTRALHLMGEYKDTLTFPELLEKIKRYSKIDFLSKIDAYSVSQIRNDANVIIRNKKQTHNADKKILILQDSFSMYLTGYLATDVPAIDVVHLLAFDGSIRNYIKTTQPDIVILIYCASNIRPIDWSIHSSPFDLR